MKSLLTLHLEVLASEGEHCCVTTGLDKLALVRRFENEGESFLTIVLPTFGKALEKGLAEGVFPLQDVTGFSHSRGLPVLMSGFLKRIFGRDGVLLADPDADCIRAVRQICYATYKVEVDCSPKRVKAALDQYVSTDEDLRMLPSRLPAGEVERFCAQANSLFRGLFSFLETKIASFQLIPSHGPGAVAERYSPEEKWQLTGWPERLEGVFPKWRYGSYYPKWDVEDHEPMGSELPVRVVTVPKTQKTPRIIAIEPVVMQYAQQALKDEIYDFVGDSVLGRILGFDDQTRNQEMARVASITGSHATLDLSEASDRVHWWLVQQMVRDFPHLRDFLSATRSRSADVPGHGVIPLTKYASMGSALTFPIEAMVFLTLAAMGVNAGGRTPLSPGFMPGKISVYGDDIIVPTDTTSNVIHTLELFGFKVNRSKSFWSGSFRESCGKEYYNGVDVTVVRQKQLWPSHSSDATRIAGLVDLRNRLFRAGMWKVTRTLDREIKKWVRPAYCGFSGETLALSTTLSPSGVLRFNPHLQREEIRVPRLVPIRKVWAVDGEPGLLKWFLEAEKRKLPAFGPQEPSQERATAFSIHSGWVPTV